MRSTIHSEGFENQFDDLGIVTGELLVESMIIPIYQEYFRRRCVVEATFVMQGQITAICELLDGI